jgi:hypothetical protein
MRSEASNSRARTGQKQTEGAFSEEKGEKFVSKEAVQRVALEPAPFSKRRRRLVDRRQGSQPRLQPRVVVRLCTRIARYALESVIETVRELLAAREAGRSAQASPRADCEPTFALLRPRGGAPSRIHRSRERLPFVHLPHPTPLELQSWMLTRRPHAAEALQSACVSRAKCWPNLCPPCRGYLLWSATFERGRKHAVWILGRIRRTSHRSNSAAAQPHVQPRDAAVEAPVDRDTSDETAGAVPYQPRFLMGRLLPGSPTAWIDPNESLSLDQGGVARLLQWIQNRSWGRLSRRSLRTPWSAPRWRLGAAA